MATPLVTNLQAFSRELEQAAKRLPARAVVALQKRIVLTALRKIVEKTPVDLGYLRANWQVTIGIPATRPQTGPPPQGDERTPRGPIVANAISTLSKLDPFQVVFISNPVPYASIIETGGFVPKNPGPSKDRRRDRRGRILVQGGYSTQAPEGMVAVTVAELLTIFT